MSSMSTAPIKVESAQPSTDEQIRAFRAAQIEKADELRANMEKAQKEKAKEAASAVVSLSKEALEALKKEQEVQAAPTQE